MTISLGAIGWRNHAAKMIASVRHVPRASVDVIYHPNYIPDVPGGTSNVRDLLQTDGIMVLSPDDTHMQYISMLHEMGYKGRILCEKPPVTSIDELARLRSIMPTNVMFNFPLRHGTFTSTVVDMLHSIERPISATVHVTHGLAFRSGYAQSWRAQHRGAGILGTVSIHWIDLFIMLFGDVIDVWHMSQNAAHTGIADDTSVLCMKHVTGVISTIVASYAAPALTHLRILGTDGIIELHNKQLTLCSPRDTFNASGEFVRPPVKSMFIFSDPFLDGLTATVSRFIDACGDDREFPPEWLASSLSTMDVIFQCNRS